MLRLLVGTGLLLMVVGFGAAGWQYWQGLPPGPEAVATSAEEPTPDGPALPSQGWLISGTGGLVDPADVRAFLVHDRLIRDRLIILTFSAPLASLLAEGETLPADPFLQVFADIRAPQVARSLCPVLTEGIAAACAVQSARVIEGSVDPARGTARFRVELAYRLRPAATELPDLALHVLNIDRLVPGLPGDGAGAPVPRSPEEALAMAVAATTAPCAAEDRALGCRLLRLSVDWTPGAPAAFEGALGWLQRLPEGMVTVAPILPATAPPEG